MSDIAQHIHNCLMKLSKEDLIAKLFQQEKLHNDFCRRAAEERDALETVAIALAPFAQMADDLEEEHWRALEVGGLVPIEDEDTGIMSVRNGDLFAARNAMRMKHANECAQNHKKLVTGVRIAIGALKDLEDEGNQKAAVALTKIRQIDPHV